MRREREREGREDGIEGGDLQTAGDRSGRRPLGGGGTHRQAAVEAEGAVLHQAQRGAHVGAAGAHAAGRLAWGRAAAAGAIRRSRREGRVRAVRTSDALAKHSRCAIETFTFTSTNESAVLGGSNLGSY